MSIGLVEEIHLRLREEIERCGYTLAAASRAIGDTGPQNLKDVVSGRKRCQADLVARLSVIGVDIFYVLAGIRAEQTSTLKPDESVLLNSYRSLPETDQLTVQRTVTALAATAGGTETDSSLKIK